MPGLQGALRVRSRDANKASHAHRPGRREGLRLMSILIVAKPAVLQRSPHGDRIQATGVAAHGLGGNLTLPVQTH